MSISVSIGNGSSFSFGALKDLYGELSTELTLGDEFSSFLDQPLSAVPAEFSSASVGYTSGAASWSPGAGTAFPLSFTLSGGVCGKISVITSGSVMKYTDGFPQTVSTGLGTTTPNSQTAKSVDVGPAEAFVALELDFQISGGLTGSYQQGVYGVSTADSASSSIRIAFYRRCTPSTPLQDALRQAFEGFVLPMHAKTLEHMAPGDYLHYNFNANLQLGVGASIGYEKVLYAGTTAQAVPGTAGAVTITGPMGPGVQAGAKFCFGYDYCGTFEVLLWCDEAHMANLHLYRAEVQNTTAGANFGLALTSESPKTVSVATDKLTALLTQSMPDALQGKMATDVLPAAVNEVNNFAGELNDKVGSWLRRKTDQKAALDLAIEHTSSTFLLTDYTVDLSNAIYPSAWTLMLAGKFLDAMQIPGSGMTLATGSGIEALFKTASSVKLNLFGALHAAWTETTISNSSLVYAGDNVFHLVTVEGKDVLTALNATKKELTVYFAAEADLSNSSMAGSRIPPPQLHCLLQATGNAGFGRAIGQLMGLLSSDPAVAALAANVTAVAQQANSTETLHLIFEPDTYATLNASNIPHGKPDDESKDAANYAAFQNACGAIYKDEPQNFHWRGRRLDYALWRNAWIASNDRWPAPDGAAPDRRECAGWGSGVLAQMGSVFPEIGEGEAQLIFYALSVAVQFMNLCDDLRTLASQTETYTPGTWKAFVDELAHMAKNDLNTDFMPAMMLALATLCSGAATTVKGPAGDLPTGSSIGVTMTYGTAG